MGLIAFPTRLVPAEKQDSPERSLSLDFDSFRIWKGTYRKQSSPVFKPQWNRIIRGHKVALPNPSSPILFHNIVEPKVRSGAIGCDCGPRGHGREMEWRGWCLTLF